MVCHRAELFKFSPLGHSVTKPVSCNATITSAPRLSTLVINAPFRLTSEQTDVGLLKVAC